MTVRAIQSADGDRARGFRNVLVSEADHPFWNWWWPPGHIIGWEHTFVHEIVHLLQAIAADVESEMAAPIESLAQEAGDGVSRIVPAESRGAHLRRTRGDGKA